MQNILWPAQTVNATNPSVASNTASPSATSSTLVAGQNPSGDQQPLQTDASGHLLVDIASASGSPIDVDVVASVLPTGAATEATLATRASEATLATRASEATLATRASESTLAAQSATITARLSGSLVPAAYDEVQLTYTGDNVTTAVYKLATVTVKTLTLSYTGDRLDSVVAS
jgi:hypothetical protein